MGGGGGFGGGGGGGGGYTDPSGGGGAGLGGAIFNNQGATLSLLNDTLTANTAQGGTGGGQGGQDGQGLGGAVFNRNGTVTILFSTLSSNTADQGGRDVYNLSDGSGQTGTANITDSILGQSGAATITDFNSTTVNGGNAPVNTGQRDLMSNPGTFPATGLVPGTDPRLAALANNGGPTPTMALLPGSPAFQAGTPVAGITTDQRGLPRPGTPSLGAFEPQPMPPSPPTPPAQTSTGLQQIVIAPDGGFAAEFVTAVVTSPGATVNGGTMSFDLAGTVLNVPVQSGRATALMIVPLPLVAMPQQIGLTFTPANLNFASSSSAQSARLTLFNALDPGFDLLRADGSQKVVAVIDGVLVGLIFNAQGQLTGFQLDLMTFNANGQFTGLNFNILPDLGAIVPFGIGIVI
jgi:hypothetical protein